ncbi:Uncharacterised protein [Klebsiella pneumoniae]|nr:Uncharacterised protein [Klebsiella pneumoniae]
MKYTLPALTLAISAALSGLRDASFLCRFPTGLSTRQSLTWRNRCSAS